MIHTFLCYPLPSSLLLLLTAVLHILGFPVWIKTPVAQNHVWYLFTILQFQKISTPTPWKVVANSKGEGGLTNQKNLMESMKLN